MSLLNDDIWGQSPSTRIVRKSIGLPLLFVAGCGMGGAALGAASIAASCFIASTPILAGVYVYKNPPPALRRLYYRWKGEVPSISAGSLEARLMRGVIISLPWRAEDINYQSTLRGLTSTGNPNGSPGFMGLQGRVSNSIFVAYLNHSVYHLVAYFVPDAYPLAELSELISDPEELLHIAYPSSTVPYSDYREDQDAVVLHRLYENIRIAAALA
jgi:hypothetical protein